MTNTVRTWHREAWDIVPFPNTVAHSSVSDIDTPSSKKPSLPPPSRKTNLCKYTEAGKGSVHEGCWEIQCVCSVRCTCGRGRAGSWEVQGRPQRPQGVWHVVMRIRWQGQLCSLLACSSTCSLSLSLSACSWACLGARSLVRAHHGSLKRPILQEAGEFQSPIGIMAAAPLLMPTGAVRVASALGASGSPTSRPASPNPRPRLCSTKDRLQPRPDAAQLGFLFPFASDTALGLPCPFLYLPCAPTSGRLPLVRVGDLTCARSRCS